MQQHTRSPFQLLLKVPLKVYYWIAVLSSLIGLFLDMLEAYRQDELFVVYANLLCALLIIISIIIFLVNNRYIRQASAIFIIALVLCIVFSNLYLQTTDNSIWQYYFLRDTSVFIILVTFTSFLLSKFYVYSLALVYSITVIVMWKIDPDSFVGHYVVFMVFMISSYSIGIELFSRRLHIAFKENEELNQLLVQRDKEILEMENQRIANELTHANDTLHLKNQELVSRAMLLAEQMEKNSHSVKKLKMLEASLNADKQKELRTIVGNLQTEDNSHWEEFQVRFSAVNQNFYTKLKKDYPDLTQGELKLAALVKLKLSSKEIAILTNTTKAGIDVSRSRLRKKLQINSGENITEFMDRY